MAIEVVEITEAEQGLILAKKENHFCDMKGRDVAPGKLTKLISAFANASGGELFVGVGEREVNGTKEFYWSGFARQEDANGHIQIFEKLFPLGQDFSYTFLQVKNTSDLVLQVEIRKTRHVCVASDDIAYVRRSSQSLPQTTPEQLERLRLDKGIVSFEIETVNVPIETVCNSVPILHFLTNVVPTAEPEPWLRKQLLIVGNKPTVAGVLLFSEVPQAALPKRCAIKIYRYKTHDAAGTRETLAFDPITIEGCLYEQIRQAVNCTVKLVEGIQKLGPKGLEAINYPLETLHEILTNAVLHRDYSITSDVHVRIFDNRIEVESPGILPGHITPDNILNEQFARNGSIVRMINKFPDPPNKDVGEGLNTAFNAMKKLRLKEPAIRETANSVVVHIRHEPLASPEESIMEYLEENPEIVNRVARQITGIASENSMKEVFYRMRDRDMIEQVPGKVGFASAWRKKT